MNVKVIFSPDVMSCESSKVDFIEYDLIGMFDTPETHCECQDSEDIDTDQGQGLFGTYSRGIDGFNGCVTLGSVDVENGQSPCGHLNGGGGV